MSFRLLSKAQKLKTVKSTSCKIPRFNLKLHAFVHDELVEFPESDITYNTVTTNNFFRNVYHMIKVKMHLHHSHVTGEILGYVHDFCNWRVRENKTEFVVFTLNFFGFDVFPVVGFSGYCLEHKRY